MRYRQHKGGYAESMATVVEIDSTREALLRAVLESLPDLDQVRPEDIEASPYGADRRNGWDTHLVTVHGYGIVGYTDGPLQN